MSDRIREIYQKARGIEIMSENFMEPWECKFAELIVIECLDQISQHIRETSIYDNDETCAKIEKARDILYDTKVHFGVTYDK